MSSDEETSTTPFLLPKTLPPKLKLPTQNQPLNQTQSQSIHDDNLDGNDDDEMFEDGEEEIVIPDNFAESLQIQLNNNNTNDPSENDNTESERITIPQLIMLLLQFMCLMYAIYRSSTSPTPTTSLVSKSSSSITTPSSTSTTTPQQLPTPPINSLQLYSHTILQSSDFDTNNFDYTPFVQDSLQYWSFQHENYYNQKPLPFHKAILTPYSDTTPKVFVQSDLTPFYEAFVRANNYTHFQHTHNEQIDPTLLPQYIPFDPYTIINTNPITYTPLSNHDNVDYTPFIITKNKNITQFQTFGYIPDEYKPRLLKQLVSKQQSHILAPLKQLFELIHNNTNINADVPNLLSPFNIYEILSPTFRSSNTEKQFDIENEFTPLQTLLPSITTSMINNNNNNNNSNGNNNTIPLTQQHSAATLKYRRNFVKEMIKHSYNGYLDSCLQHDQIQPITGQCHNIFGTSLTLFDSLSTLYITGLHDELTRSVTYLLKQFKLNGNGFNRYSSSFELGIRFMGGLASYIDLSGDIRVIPLLEEFVEKWSLSCFPKLTMRNINAYKIGYKQFLQQYPQYKYQPETTHPFNLSRKSKTQQQNDASTTTTNNNNSGTFQSSSFYPSPDLRVPIDLDSSAILQAYIASLETKVNSKVTPNSKSTSSTTSKTKQKQQSTTSSSSSTTDSTTWMPFPHINIVERKGKFDGWASEYILSEIGTLQIELLAISDIVSNPIYYELGRGIIEHITRNYLVQSITPDHIFHSMGKPQPILSKTTPTASTKESISSSSTSKTKSNAKVNSNTNFDTTSNTNTNTNNNNKKIDPIILSGYENYIEHLYQNYKTSNSPINDLVTQLQNLNGDDTPLLTTSTIPQLIQFNTIEPSSIDPIQSRLALPQSITSIVPLIPENTALVSPNLLPPNPLDSALIPQNDIDSAIVPPNLIPPNNNNNNNNEQLLSIEDDTTTTTSTSLQYPPLLPTFTFPTFYNKLPPHIINQSTGMTFGGLGDSFYEVLLKQWIMTGKRNNILQNLYLDSIRGLQLYNYFQINGIGMLGLYQPNDSVYLPSLYPQSIQYKKNNNNNSNNNNNNSIDNEKQKVLNENIQDKSITIPTTNNDIIPKTTTTTGSDNELTSPPLPIPDTTMTLPPLPDGTNQITSPPLPNAETTITLPPLPESYTQLTPTSTSTDGQQQLQHEKQHALPDGNTQLTSPPLPPSDTELTSPPLPDVQLQLDQQDKNNELPSPPDIKSIPSPNTKSLPSSSQSTTTTTPTISTTEKSTTITKSNIELDETKQQRNTLQLSSEHLNCFAGGMLGLGVQHGIIPTLIERQKHLYLAEQLTLSCALSYLVSFHNQTTSSEQFSLLTYDLNYTLPKPPLHTQYYVPSNTNTIAYNLTTYHIHTDPTNPKSQLRLRRYYQVPNELPDINTTLPTTTTSKTSTSKTSTSTSSKTYYTNDPMFTPKLYESIHDEILLEDPQHIDSDFLPLKHYSINQAVLRSLVRPETVESLYILHSITKSPIYRDLAWFITQSIQILFSAPYGYTATISQIQNHAYVNTTTLAEHNRRNFHICEDNTIPFFSQQCQDEHPNGFFTYRPIYMIESGLLPTNAQDSWIVAETLKYLYLIFSEDYEEVPKIDHNNNNSTLPMHTHNSTHNNNNNKIYPNITKSYIDYATTITNKTHIGHKKHHSSKLLEQWVFTTEAHVLRQRHHLPFLF